jgi:4-hydroxy-tetrahydrodipicolinate synthase
MQTTTAGGTPAMRDPDRRFGLSCATITPFAANGSVDVPRFLSHLHRCIGEGCDSFTLFGTTGEGASVGLSERNLVLESVIDSFDGDKILVGVAASAPEDAAAQANPLLDAGGRGLLLAPPFYFKGIDDEGLYAWFSRAIEAMHAPRGVFLYHLPSVTHVPLSLSLIGRLKQAFPRVIAGVKDSGGEWSYTEQLLRTHADLHILVGDERLLARAMRHGASGAINGFSNFCARRLRPMIERGEEDPGLSALVDLLLTFPVTPGVKALVAHVARDQRYARAAPPLRTLSETDAAALVAAFEAL